MMCLYCIDASSTVVNMTDSNVTDDGDEDYVPNDVTGEETSPDDQILQPSDEQSDVTPENEIKKEEPDDSGGKNNQVVQDCACFLCKIHIM